MSKPSGRRWLPIALRWLLGMVLLAYAAFGPDTPAPASLEADEADAADEGLRIKDVRPVRSPAGGVVVVRVLGVDPDGAALSATLDGEPVDVVHETPSLVAIRLPEPLEQRRWKVRVVQGDTRSKGRDVWVRGLAYGPVVRNVLGGLALLVLGLRSLARGLRGYAGKKLRALVAGTTTGGMRPLALGLVLGAVAQSTVPAVGLLVGLAQAGLVGLAPALTVLIGAQLGSSATALVLPVGADREALLLVALGVAWIGVGVDRRRVAEGEAILGLGLLFFGVALLRQGLSPLVAEPALFDQVQRIASGGVAGMTAAAMIGAVLGVVMQGPAPAFGVVMGAAESTGLIGLRGGLEILAGIWLGVASVTALVAWPIGPGPRRMAAGYAILAIVGAALALASVPLWMHVSDALVPGEPGQVAYGRQVLLPKVGEHLGVGFFAMQLFVTLVGLAFLPRLARALGRTKPLGSGAQGSEREILSSVGVRLLSILDAQRRALGMLLGMVQSLDLSEAESCRRLVEGTGKDLEACLVDLVAVGDRAESRALRGVSVSLTLVNSGLSGLQRIAERGVEESIDVEDASLRALGRVHELVVSVIEALTSALIEDTEPSVDAARAKEIRINHAESEARERLSVGIVEGNLPRALHTTALLSAYEGIANHLYHAHEALGERLG